MEYIHTKRRRPSNFSQNDAAKRNQEFVFKWVPVKGERISVEANRAVYEEYKQVRGQLLKDTVYNPDGTENKEGISRLRQAGLTDKEIYERVAKDAERIQLPPLVSARFDGFVQKRSRSIRRRKSVLHS